MNEFHPEKFEIYNYFRQIFAKSKDKGLIAECITALSLKLEGAEIVNMRSNAFPDLEVSFNQTYYAVEVKFRKDYICDLKDCTLYKYTAYKNPNLVLATLVLGLSPKVIFLNLRKIYEAQINPIYLGLGFDKFSPYSVDLKIENDKVFESIKIFNEIYKGDVFSACDYIKQNILKI
jgi:hypothetical protein